MKPIAPLAILSLLIAGTALSNAQQPLSVADLLANKGPAPTLPLRDLPDAYKPVKIVLPADATLTSLMYFQVGARLAQNSPFDLIGTSWTTGELVDFAGHPFLVTYRLEPSQFAASNATPSLNLNLIRLDSIVSIAPASGMTKQQALEAFTALTVPTAGGTTAPTTPESPGAPPAPAPMTASAKTRGLSNLKQIAVGQIIYLSDNNDVLPYVQNTATVRVLLTPYLKNDQLWKNPNPRGGRILFNMALASVAATSIPNPAEVPLFYDENAWPDGTRMVAFLDGHVKAVPATAWPKVQALLTAKYPKVPGKPIPIVKETQFQ